ncbi:MAG: c-type cytochrome [Methyloligellaceae bacterium]
MVARLDRQSLILLGAAVVAGLGIAYWHANRPTGVAVRVPALSAEAQLGRAMFERSCVVCHGPNASGTKSGPPLIHKVYESNHHSDQAFHRAVQKGVRAHHWPFGDMPPVGDVKPSEVNLIVRYVRELQRANGIF